MRNQVTGTVEHIAHAGHGRALIEPRLFDGGADENRAEARRHEITSRSPHDAIERGAVGRELQQLPRIGLTGSAGIPSISICPDQLPAATTLMRGDARIVVELDAELTVSMLDASRARRHYHSSAVLDGGGRQRPAQIPGDDESMRFMNSAPDTSGVSCGSASRTACSSSSSH